MEQLSLEKIMEELLLIKSLLSKITGTSELPQNEKFSMDALNKAAHDFQKLSIERGEWIEEGSIHKVIKSARYHGNGKFIREHFGFSNYFKRGRSYYYNKADLILLGKELKERNIDLGTYIDFIEDQINFKKSVAEAMKNTNGKKGRKNFKLPSDVKNITSEPHPLPSADLIRRDLKLLKEEFFEYKLSDYIDIFNDSYAMVKIEYHFDKYIKPEIKKRCTKWASNFNYANHALELVTKKKETFIPIKDEDMYQL